MNARQRKRQALEVVGWVKEIEIQVSLLGIEGIGGDG